MIFLLLILEFNSEANFYIRKSPPNNIRFNHNNYAMWIYQKNKKTKNIRTWTVVQEKNCP